MDVQVGDILVMKKEHPCGTKQWLVLRSGMDFRLRCTGSSVRTAVKIRWPTRRQSAACAGRDMQMRLVPSSPSAPQPMSQNAPNSASPVTTAGRISPGRCRSSRSSACSCALRRDSRARPSGKNPST